ncbi:SRPBCC family protein [Phytoactinopolyspora limicola]|uniref:SRPBCC family protein n=1 Tax=Phytoactinopolyspora limicola TaxID=2715536 RepID=UPI00140D329D|nr:SRPBCC domain-containing protein [Phytoactinopolyspora limicola]
MGHHFEAPQDAEFDADPDLVWQAIATGPGINSWFMGRTEVESGIAGAVRTAFGEHTPEHRVTTWDPPRRLTYESGQAPDGRRMAYEFLIEGRKQGSTSLRMVVSGFLPDDDWEAEYDAMTSGLHLFFRTLVEYVTHFPGRTAVPLTVFGPAVSNWEQIWPLVYRALGLPDQPAGGDPARFTGPDGVPIDAVVYHVNPDSVGLRTDTAMYRFVKGFNGPLVAMHHVFADIEPASAETAWHRWLDQQLT